MLAIRGLAEKQFVFGVICEHDRQYFLLGGILQMGIVKNVDIKNALSGKKEGESSMDAF
ncbi:hypothetical protein [Draconibacterium sediminis]|uniref:hypothetical protein n=1 Tax=Draconibacterium sediminis TaxID=1544798 RepID=UPI0026F04079|nr:hypothetical protein [Draconibacterium sediminis]